MSAPTETRCNACGRAATVADRFCGHCGARLDADSSTPAPEATGAHRPHADRILAALRSATMGEYDIAGELGRGGMAVVFLAHDLALNRKVAIKALLPELLYTEGMDRRFKHEARTAAKLDHPNILVIHGVREANDLLFIVMKLVDGLPLSAIVRAAGPLPIPVVRLVVRHVAEALAYAHGEGVVHRDVKPANIMVDRRGNVIVMDFGIAKAADDSHLTRTGLVIGTPAYMSPEQCLAQGASPASDQYSLGVVAHELLTGGTPFRGSALEMQWAHATTVAPGVRTLRPDCPPALDALVQRMLAKAPGDRCPSLQDVADALADDPATASAARSALVRLVSEAPGLRGDTLPATPASPVPIGTAPALAGVATTRPAASATHGQGAHSARPAAAPPLTLSQQRIELRTGDSVELIVELDANGQAASDAAVAWESSDSRVAVVSPAGFVTAVGPGLAEVACEWRGKRAVCVVHVAVGVVGTPAAVSASPGAAAPRAESLAPAPKPSPAAPVVAPARPLTPPSAAATARPRAWWWMGVAAASIGAAALYFGPRRAGNGEAELPRAAPTVPPAAVATTATTALTASAPPSAAPAGPAAPRGRRPPSDSAPNAAAEAGRGVPGPAMSQETSTRSTARPPTVERPKPRVPPSVPAARLDTRRLTSARPDSGAGYAASRPATPAVPPPPRASDSTAYSPPAPARDSTADRLPAPAPDVAAALFEAFATAVNARVYSRITAAYSQPGAAADVTLWQGFLVFVRDYTPRATVRSTTVDATTNPPTITATIDFRWTGDAGFDRRRPATFTGVGVPVTGGWSLHRVRLVKKFW